jgi:hypothetical protein
MIVWPSKEVQKAIRKMLAAKLDSVQSDQPPMVVHSVMYRLT